MLLLTLMVTNLIVMRQLVFFGDLTDKGSNVFSFPRPLKIYAKNTHPQF